MAHLPSPPFVAVDGIANFRDIGGYQTSSNKHVQSGLVYRCADPSKATEDGLQKMSKDLGIKVIFDLRSENEIKRDGPEWAGVEADNPDSFAAHGIKREWVPVFAKEDYGPEQVGLRYKNYTRAGSEGFVIAYRDISKSAPTAYGAIFRHLAQPKATPCVVHCTAGKDRTGVVVALLLMLAGVEDEKIAEEYSLTDLGLEHLKPLFIERLIKNPALEGNREGVGNMVSSKKENMAATLTMLRKEYGSAEGYMNEQCKMGHEEIAQIKKNLLA